jgi:hypothetical protein
MDIDCFPGTPYQISFFFFDHTEQPLSEPHAEPQTCVLPPSSPVSRLFTKASEIFSLPIDQVSLAWEAVKIPRNFTQTLGDLFGQNTAPHLTVRAEVSVKVVFPNGTPQPGLFVEPIVMVMGGLQVYVEAHAEDCLIRLDPRTPINLFWEVTDKLFPKMVAIAPTGWSERPKLGIPIPKLGQAVLNLRIRLEPIVIEVFFAIFFLIKKQSINFLLQAYPENDVQFVFIKVNNAETGMYVLPEIPVYDLMLRAIGEIEMHK